MDFSQASERVCCATWCRLAKTLSVSATPVKWSCTWLPAVGNVDAFRYFADLDAPIDTVSKNGVTPLMDACGAPRHVIGNDNLDDLAADNTLVMSFLLSRDADRNAPALGLPGTMVVLCRGRDLEPDWIRQRLNNWTSVLATTRQPAMQRRKPNTLRNAVP